MLARVMFSAVSSMLGWCARHRHVAVNVCSGLHRPEPSKPRDRVLTSAEVVTFWKACHQVGEPHGSALKLLLLTGCRNREIAALRREELSDDFATLSLPGGRTKNGRPHTVPLPPLARDILANVTPVAGAYVFSTNGKAPIGLGSKLKHRLDALMGISHFVLHDLRRTFVTHLNELGVPPHVIELTVNHVSGSRGGIAGVYNKAEMMPERKAALERWAAHIEGLVSGKSGKVLTMPKQRGRK
jgi:integrase